MEFAILLLFGLLIYAFVMPAVASSQANKALAEVERLRRELQQLRAELALRREGAEERPAPLPGTPPPLSALQRAKTAAPVPGNPAPNTTPVPPAAVSIPFQPIELPSPQSVTTTVIPPPAEPVAATVKPPALIAKPPRQLSLEQFMGVKLFAWVGGLALFIGIVLFVKYSFEHNLISPAMREIIGAVLGLTMCGTGLYLRDSARFRVLAQTLCATGVVTLYGVSFGGHVFYDLYSQGVAFFMAAAVTAAAFFIAVRMEAQVVAVLGIAGGFLAPVILSTGHDRPLALFSYATLLNAGVLAVVHCRRWPWHTTLAAVCTAATMSAWAVKFWETSGYGAGAATFVPAAVFIFFPLLFCAAGWWLARRTELSRETLVCAAALALLGITLCAAVVLSPGLASRPWLLFGFVFVQNLLTAAAAWREPRLLWTTTYAGIGAFALLAVWSGAKLDAALMPHALVLYLIFGVLQAGFPLLWQRLKREGDALPAVTLLMPLLVLLLLFTSLMRVPGSATGIWITALAANGGILMLGLAARRAGPVVAALALTMIMIGAWIPAILTGPGRRDFLPGEFLFVLLVFALLLTAGGLLMREKLAAPGDDVSAHPLNALPLVPAVLSFPLLIIAALALPRIPFAGFSAVTLALAALLLVVAVHLRLWLLFPLTLLAVAGVEATLYLDRGIKAADGERLCWQLATWALFLTAPFLRRRVTREDALPWITAAASGAVQFLFIYPTVHHGWPALEPGLIPAACILPPALALWLVWKDRSPPAGVRLSQLAWLAGVTLLFVTLVVPIQWERQWLTLGWALEGAALCWLFRRVPHAGLRWAGAALLTTAFVRLVFNEATLTYQPRTTPLWNWLLYTYGLTIAAHAAAARWLAPPRHLLIPGWNVRAQLLAQAGVLLFVLINLEIADFFTPAGSPYIVLEFAGNFARDMTVSIAWALYSLALIAGGLWRRSRGVRWAGVSLMGITLLKLFLADLAQIGSLYRVAATIAVSLLSLAASYLYQRFAAVLEQETAGPGNVGIASGPKLE